MRSETIDAIVTIAVNILWTRAIHGDGKFRQWFYPSLPRSNEINPDAYAEAEQMVLAGERDAQQIADQLYRTHA